MGESKSWSSEFTLVSIAGPSPVSLPLRPPGPITIGRASHHNLVLKDPHVSREHARLVFDVAKGGGEADSAQGQWMLTDLGSTQGTWLNGVRLQSGRMVPIRASDVIVIGPWTLRVVVPAGSSPGQIDVNTIDDSQTAGTIITRVDPSAADTLARERLSVLLNCAASIHAATNERALARIVIDACLTGTGFSNAAVFQAGAENEQLTVLACQGPAFAEPATMQISRSLIEEALSGTPASLTTSTDIADRSRSIADLRVTEALCVPIELEASIVAFLYLDNRADQRAISRVRDDASGFAVGIARLAAMALANLRRHDVERRQAKIEAELTAAANVQQLLLPRREGQFESLSYLGESRMGRYLGGDFFDVIPLENKRLAVALGDVSGKGAEASVLATATQGFLHAALAQHGDSGRAVTALNSFLHTRCPSTKFLTLWVGVFDIRTKTLSFVDAGHGHAVLFSEDGTIEQLKSAHDGPVGILPHIEYQALTRHLKPSGKLLVVSDGVVEEYSRAVRGPEQTNVAGTRTRDFGMAGVQQCLRSLPPGADEVAALFAAVESFAGTSLMADDATILVVRW